MKRIFIISTAVIVLLGCITLQHADAASGNTSPKDQQIDEVTRLIQKYRMGEITVKTAPHAKVSLKQLKHEFWFGAAIAAGAFNGSFPPADRKKYLQILKENFNSAVPENAMKWPSIERQQGVYTYQDCDAILKWCDENDFIVRGHCIFWANKHYVQDWIKNLDNPALKQKIRSRANHLLKRYKGRVGEYDVNNEMIHHSFYKDRFGEAIRLEMFDYCKAADPDAVLYVNDYRILNGRDLEKYEDHIRSLLAANAPIGGIGLQGHFGPEGVNVEKVKYVLDRIAKFNLPIKITEFDINSSDESPPSRKRYPYVGLWAGKPLASESRPVEKGLDTNTLGQSIPRPGL